eukprot:8701975-Lingulodinium_polyedra.AAC.2
MSSVKARAFFASPSSCSKLQSPISAATSVFRAAFGRAFAGLAALLLASLLARWPWCPTLARGGEVGRTAAEAQARRENKVKASNRRVHTRNARQACKQEASCPSTATRPEPGVVPPVDVALNKACARCRRCP